MGGPLMQSKRCNFNGKTRLTRGQRDETPGGPLCELKETGCRASGKVS
jgi:hypothetical protein